ncbi:hypothetical protein OG592_41055 (plasmid) [Streptomyces avidinii]|uniref:hypothetical protein n=1 Tax=Streptomyces avidinii TaxID=1895 RepID=UPI0038655937|nr:hypothetical protein OG592_41055 [Streptomyces avidinii]
MSAAVITASASIVVAVLAFLLAQRAQVLQERRQAHLARVNAQLRELYGPLLALVDVNEKIWESLRATSLPPQTERSPEAGTAEWVTWRNQVLMPANREMCELIKRHADLIEGPAIPEPLLVLCAHVLALEIAMSSEASGVLQRPLVRHPGADYVDYVRTTFSLLKAEQQKLLR